MDIELTLVAKEHNTIIDSKKYQKTMLRFIQENVTPLAHSIAIERLAKERRRNSAKLDTASIQCVIVYRN
jgi:hypothetical protein